MKNNLLLKLIGCFLVCGVLINPLFSAAKTVKQMSLEELKSEMKKGLQYKRIIVIQTMAKKYPKDSLEYIIEAMLHDKVKHVRRAAQRALIGHEDERIFKSLQSGVEHQKKSVRLAAVDALGAIKDPVAFELLIETIQKNEKDKELVLLALESMRTVAYHVEPAPALEVELIPWLSKGNKKIKITTIIILSLLGRPAALPALMDSWEKSSTRIKIYLCDAYANIGHIAPLPLLLQATKSKHKPLVMHALYAIAQIQSTEALSAIWTLMEQSDDPRVVMACLYALTEIGDESSVEPIIKIMDSTDPTILHWSAYTLGQLKAKTATKVLMEKLNHQHSLVKATAAIALGEINVKQAENRLLKLLEDQQETEEVKVAVTKALMAIGSQKGSEYFWQALQKPRLDTSVYLTYAMAVANAKDTNYKKKLLVGLSHDEFNMRFVYAVAVGSIGEKQALPILINALEHSYGLIRRYAVIGLESIADEQAVHALAQAANDDRDEVVRILCASSLMRLGYPDYEIILWNALDTKEEDIRSEALVALGSHLDETMVAKLKWYLRREPSIPVRQTIHRLLRNWHESQ